VGKKGARSLFLTGVALLLPAAELTARQKGEARDPNSPPEIAHVQEEPRQGSASPSWIILPNVFTTPETGFAGGLAVAYFPNGGEGDRPSMILASLVVTQKRQITAQLLPELYLREGSLWLKDEIRSAKYPDVFYGIGNTAPKSAQEDFTSRYVDVDALTRLEVRDGFWVGLDLRFRSEDVTKVEAGGLLAAGGIPGDGGATVLGAGPVFTLDTRDRVLQPRRGTFGEVKWTGFRSLSGLDGGFGAGSADLRHYLPVGERSVLALQGKGQLTSGTAPFTLLPKLGGNQLMRGYREGRFRDDVLAVLQAELRFPLVWRFGGAVFGGVGEVAAGVDAFPGFGDWERAAGLGLRFRLNEAGATIRVDWARGREGSGLYVGFGEAF
jgi:hypothetical protein